MVLVAALTLRPGVADAAAVAQGTQPWPRGEVPYQIDKGLLAQAGAAGTDCTGWTRWREGRARKACQAMAEWQAASGVRFVADTRRFDRLAIIPGAGTDATPGHWPLGNRVRIESGATYGSVLHEFGHVLGLMHEHQRPDRDRYLVLAPFLRDDLAHCVGISAVCRDVRLAFPVTPMQMASPYDPCSLMHYLANQAPRHREDGRWGHIFALTKAGEAAHALCVSQFVKLPARCGEVGQKCTISRDDAAIVRRFNAVKG
jgi:hypothetical protein